MRKITVRFDRRFISEREGCTVTTIINGFVIGDQLFATVEAASCYEEMIRLLFDPNAKDEEEAA